MELRCRDTASPAEPTQGVAFTFGLPVWDPGRTSSTLQPRTTAHQEIQSLSLQGTVDEHFFLGISRSFGV
jgi:hypothetical protein